MGMTLEDKVPSKRLVLESFEVLELLNSQEYRELQNNFDSLYSQIKKEQLMMLQIVEELKVNHTCFIQKNDKLGLDHLIIKNIDVNIKELEIEKNKVFNLTNSLLIHHRLDLIDK